jgi:hypothetical protein
MKDLVATRDNKMGEYNIIRSGIVTRRTMGACCNGRRGIVSLIPGDIIEIREAGRRTGYEASIGWVYIQLAKRYAMQAAELAAKKREAKREGIA